MLILAVLWIGLGAALAYRRALSRPDEIREVLNPLPASMAIAVLVIGLMIAIPFMPLWAASDLLLGAK